VDADDAPVQLGIVHIVDGRGRVVRILKLHKAKAAVPGARCNEQTYTGASGFGH